MPDAIASRPVARCSAGGLRLRVALVAGFQVVEALPARAVAALRGARPASIGERQEVRLVGRAEVASASSPRTRSSPASEAADEPPAAVDAGVATRDGVRGGVRQRTAQTIQVRVEIGHLSP